MPSNDQAQSSIQCAAYIGGGRRCPNMGLRQHEELVDADGTGRRKWLSWCDFHHRWNEERHA